MHLAIFPSLTEAKGSARGQPSRQTRASSRCRARVPMLDTSKTLLKVVPSSTDKAAFRQRSRNLWHHSLTEMLNCYIIHSLFPTPKDQSGSLTVIFISRKPGAPLPSPLRLPVPTHRSQLPRSAGHNKPEDVCSGSERGADAASFWSQKQDKHLKWQEFNRLANKWLRTRAFQRSCPAQVAWLTEVSAHPAALEHTRPARWDPTYAMQNLRWRLEQRKSSCCKNSVGKKELALSLCITWHFQKAINDVNICTHWVPSKTHGFQQDPNFLLIH